MSRVNFPMSRANLSQERPVEFFMLMKPRADGPIVGTYADHPIAARVIDLYGRRYSYAGVAPRLRNGRYDLGSLCDDEWLVEPGLIYRGDRRSSGDARAKLHLPVPREPTSSPPG